MFFWATTFFFSVCTKKLLLTVNIKTKHLGLILVAEFMTACKLAKLFVFPRNKYTNIRIRKKTGELTIIGMYFSFAKKKKDDESGLEIKSSTAIKEKVIIQASMDFLLDN